MYQLNISASLTAEDSGAAMAEEAASDLDQERAPSAERVVAAESVEGLETLDQGLGSADRLPAQV
jgi:hypothetical protein